MIGGLSPAPPSSHPQNSLEPSRNLKGCAIHILCKFDLYETRKILFNAHCTTYAAECDHAQCDHAQCDHAQCDHARPHIFLHRELRGNPLACVCQNAWVFRLGPLGAPAAEGDGCRIPECGESRRCVLVLSSTSLYFLALDGTGRYCRYFDFQECIFCLNLLKIKFRGKDRVVKCSSFICFENRVWLIALN